MRARHQHSKSKSLTSGKQMRFLIAWSRAFAHQILMIPIVMNGEAKDPELKLPSLWENGALFIIG